VTRRQRALATVAAVAAAASAAVACGVPGDGEPRAITPEDAPIDLNPTTTAPSEGVAELFLYFVHEGQLVAVERAAPADTVTAAVEALLAGPSPEDAEAAGVDQLTTRIPVETELRQVLTDASDPDRTVAFINLGCSPDAVDPTACGLLGFSGTDQAIMMGQIACTVSNIDGVDAVSFLHEGQPQPASLADGTTSTDAVRCADYRDLTSDGT
jgi:spore germination protein GerM